MIVIANRNTRAIVLGGIVIGLALLVRVVPLWWGWVDHARREAERQNTAVEEARQRIRLAPHRRRTAATLDQAYFDAEPAFVDGATPAQASASLASYVTQAATEAGVQLGSVKLLTDSSAKRKQTYFVRVQLDASGDIRGFSTFLQLLETGTRPLVAIRKLSISQPNPAAPANVAESLRGSLEVEGIAHASDD